MSLSEVSISEMLKDLMLEIDMGALKYGQEFVTDLNKFFKERGFLTEKQQTSLRKIYRNHIGT